MIYDEQFSWISDRACVKDRTNFSPEVLFGLKPGDKVTKIGCPGKSGKLTSKHRTDEFSLPLIYKGTIILEDYKWMAFEVPKEGISGVNLFSSFDSLCLLYGIIGEGDDAFLIAPLRRAQNTLSFKPVFNQEHSRI